MKIRTLFAHLRLLPAVIVLAAALLAIKGVDLVQDARAEAATGQAGAAASQAADPAAGKTATSDHNEDAAEDDVSASAAEVDVLTSLSKRRDALDMREQALNMRANLLSAAERRVDAKIADLKSLESQIQTLLGHRDDAEQKQLTALVKVYSAMKPRDAARIFNTLDEIVLLHVASAMKPDALAAIMAAMQPQQAQDLTVKLADRLKLPKKPELAPNPQLAAALPASGTAPDAASGTGAESPPAPASPDGTSPSGAPAPAQAPPGAGAAAQPASGG